MPDDVSFSLPRDVAALVTTERSVDSRDRHGNIKEWSYHIGPEQENLHLAFFRFAPDDPGKPFEGHNYEYLQALADRWDANGPAHKCAEALAGRQEARTKGLRQQGWHTKTLELETASRLASGLGYDNAFENGMTLHPLYGVPYLPGTAVKGVARSYAVEVAGADAARIRTVFGSPPEAAPNSENGDSDKQLGAVRFFDAHPLGFPSLEVDVMTPHYPDYYQGDEPPDDGQQPKIIPFLTVATGESYRFALASREADALRGARRWLRGGLRELGIGGKTSAGYGVFWSDEDRAEARRELQEAAKKAEQEQREAALPDRATRVGKRTTGLLARVVGPSPKRNVKLLVELHVEGYEGRATPMTGRFNADGFDEGEWIEVDVEQFSKKKGAALVRYKKRFRV